MRPPGGPGATKTGKLTPPAPGPIAAVAKEATGIRPREEVAVSLAGTAKLEPRLLDCATAARGGCQDAVLADPRCSRAVCIACACSGAGRSPDLDAVETGGLGVDAVDTGGDQEADAEGEPAGRLSCAATGKGICLGV
mmetsp:Transcript_56043/g.100760  ORF Transcript_56043/g.100760 Transcript_56043/m.100760 type:complete len:138 (+) Transcript_56043:189-602(+)